MSLRDHEQTAFIHVFFSCFVKGSGLTFTGAIGKRKAVSSSSPPFSQSPSWSTSPFRNASRSSVWSSIPLHLLHPASSQAQARLYSSSTDKADSRYLDYFEQSTNDAKDSEAKGEERVGSSSDDPAGNFASVGPTVEAEPEVERSSVESPNNEDLPVENSGAASISNETPAASSTAFSPPTFGFQSLSGLFTKPKPVSRPVEDYRFTKDDQFDQMETHADPDRWNFKKPSNDSFPLSSEQSSGDERTTASDEPGRRTMRREKASGNSRESPPRAAADRALGASSSDAKYTPVAESVPRRPNPFVDSSTPDSRVLQEGIHYKRITPPGIVHAQAQKPWGLSTEDSVSVDSVLEPGSQVDVTDSTRETAAPIKRTKAKSIKSDKPAKTTTTPSAKSEGAAKLTHLTSTGEAHMVDVGAKGSTRRVAVAFGVVNFSNPAAYRLIKENANKKGDVLGVARIAGIMAAKRASDLIPLCHPLALTKVEVDVNLHKDHSGLDGMTRSTKHPLVTIQVLVECTGPTGVEMEALSGLSGAALTVYDMCKAVDKKMMIGDCNVVYKSGGRSGLHCKTLWARSVGEGFFAERGLQQHDLERLEMKDDLRAVQLPERNADEPRPEQSATTEKKVSLSQQREDNTARSTTARPEESTIRITRNRKKEDYGSLWTPPRTSSKSADSQPASARSHPDVTDPATAKREVSSGVEAYPHKCKVCLQSFEDNASLQRHFTTEHNVTTPPVPTKCKTCNAVLPSKTGLLNHLVTEHSWTVRDATSPRDGEGEAGVFTRSARGNRPTRIYSPPKAGAKLDAGVNAE